MKLRKFLDLLLQHAITENRAGMSPLDYWDIAIPLTDTKDPGWKPYKDKPWIWPKGPERAEVAPDLQELFGREDSYPHDDREPRFYFEGGVAGVGWIFGDDKEFIYDENPEAEKLELIENEYAEEYKGLAEIDKKYMIEIRQKIAELEDIFKRHQEETDNFEPPKEV